MEKRGIIKITSSKDRQFNTKLSHQGSEYFIITDKYEKENILIKTSVYKSGKHVKTITQKVLERDADLNDLMNKQHQSVVEKIKKNNFFLEARETIFREINRLISKGQLEDATEIARNALKELPDDPMLNSYYGYLIAEKGLIDEALRHCKKAIKKASRTVGSEVILSTLYLHLGKVQLLKGDKRAAIKSFRVGLGYDPSDKAIIEQLNLLGVRSAPVIPFLSRDHFLNKYLGILRARLRK